MAPKDKDKMSFTTNKGLYCYKVMSFGLKNVGDAHQYLVNKIFKDLIDCNMKVYMNDMLVKN